MTITTLIFKDYRYTSRQYKGYHFERIIGNLFTRSNISFESNPLDHISKWAHSQGKGSDFQVGPIEIDAKYSNAIIHPSWIYRDWLPRFSKDAVYKIACCNQGIQLPGESLALLDYNNIEVCFYDEIVHRIEELIEELIPFIEEYFDQIYSKCNNKDPSSITKYLRFINNRILKVACSIVQYLQGLAKAYNLIFTRLKLGST